MGVKYECVGDTIWRPYRRMVVPVGPVAQAYTISKEQQRFLLSRFRECVLVRYTDGFRAGLTSGSWYAVVCRKFIELGEYKSRLRNQVRRGLNNCVAKRIDAEHVATHGYDVFMASFDRYKNGRAPDISRDEFRQRVSVAGDFPDLREYWGVFVEGELAGYSSNSIFDTTEASYTQIKLHPKFLNAYPSYALLFRMNEYYLREKGFAYVNDGFRSLLHESRMQDFLQHKFGFERAYTNLYLRYRPQLALALSMPTPVKALVGRFVPDFRALIELDRARTR